MSRIQKVYGLVLVILLSIHIVVWAKEERYSFSIFLAFFISFASTLTIYQYLSGKKMIMGKFDLKPHQKGLRAIFFGYAILFFVISYGAAIGVFKIT
jgi:hypothetical protein